MAKQIGDIKLTGTVDDLVFYHMGGDYYVRTKSSLTGKRFRRDKAFEGSRRSAGLLGAASALAAGLYRLLPKERKSRDLFRELTGKVKLKLAANADAGAIGAWFRKAYLPAPAGDESTAPPARKAVGARVVETAFSPGRLRRLLSRGGRRRAVVPGNSAPVFHCRDDHPAAVLREWRIER